MPDEPSTTSDRPTRHVPVAPPRTLSEDLHRLLAEAAGRPITVHQLERAMRGRGITVVILVMAIPFLLPIPTMGLSAPFGLAIALMGLRLSLGLTPHLPTRVRQRVIQNQTLEKIVKALGRLGRVLERFARPRYLFMFWPGLSHSIGLGILLSALVMSLPLPIPFSNAIPAAAIILLAIGLMERDGLIILLGQTTTLAAFGYLYIWWEAVVAVWQQFFG